MDDHVKKPGCHLVSTLPLARYRLDFVVMTPLFLPVHASSALRGVFGRALRAASCITREKTCDACPLLHSCPYTVVFETRPPEQSEGLWKNFSQVPHPYVIEPSQWGEHLYSPGELLSFHLVLAGRAISHLALILHAFTRAFLRGVSTDSGTARLERVTHIGVKSRVILEGMQGVLQSHDSEIPPAPILKDTVHLHFTSPLRLQKEGHPIDGRQLVARDLLMALVRRVALMHEFHGLGILPLDFTQLATQAGRVTGKNNLSWRDPVRYSCRQKQEILLGGVVGRWVLRGDLAPFSEFLHLGQWLHVGKGASFGLGAYQMSMPRNQKQWTAEGALTGKASLPVLSSPVEGTGKFLSTHI
jgi:hypothetical protein